MLKTTEERVAEHTKKELQMGWKTSGRMEMKYTVGGRSVINTEKKKPFVLNREQYRHIKSLSKDGL